MRFVAKLGTAMALLVCCLAAPAAARSFCKGEALGSPSSKELASCSSALEISKVATDAADEAAQKCVRGVNDDTTHPYTRAFRKQFVAAFSDEKGPPTRADLATGVYRCMASHLVGCLVGANLPCFKMDASKQNPGADAYCRDSPNSDTVPLVASGHGSRYEYKCVGTRAEIKSTMYQLDRRGFAKGLWRTLN